MAQSHGEEKIGDGVRASLEQAVEFSMSCQQPDGHWVAPVSADATFTAQYVMFKYAISGLSLADDGPALQRWLLNDQNADGSWGLAPRLSGNLSTSVEAYLALRILGTPATDPAMKRARDFVLRNGGVARVRFFTRFFLATFGLVPWAAIPQMPAELILLPTWAILNIYVLSSWSRSTLIPVLVVRHHEPIYALPNGRSANNDFLDELWCDPTQKHVPYAPPLWELFWGRERDAIKLGFTMADMVLHKLGGLKRGPLRKLALKGCVDWLLEHQEKEGDWAGFFPPMHGSVWALIMEGFPLDHKAVRLGLEALERLAINDASGKWLQSTISPVWDTALMLNALCDAGLSGDERVIRATRWLQDRQLMVPYGDWRFYANTSQAGGWSFQYYNSWYPDTDDTAVVVMALVKQDPGCINSECISNALEWLLGMQNRDGGWAAFDISNDARWLHKIPFSDMDSLIDPSTADVTGRLLECLGLLLAQRKGARLRSPLRDRLQVSYKRGLAFLIKEQNASGAWWGRWGNNYNYGTTNVLRGLSWFAQGDLDARRAAMRGVRWLEKCQNDDGGWGEDLMSYVKPGLAGSGPSAAAQTAWAVDSLLRYHQPSHPAIEKGMRWLVSNQTGKTEHQTERNGATWPMELYAGTGFPNVLYLGYPFYHHLFPIQALSRYLTSLDYQQAETAGQGLQLAPHVTSALSQPSVLMMVLGSRGDIEVFLSLAKRLQGCRVRIATHPSHQALVEKYGFEFYNVGGSPDEIARVLEEEPRIWLSMVRGDMARLRRSLCLNFRRFWQASIDRESGGVPAFAKFSDSKTSAYNNRPFLADVVVASSATTAHTHAAEKLQIPLVLIAAQPALATRDFPPFSTMTKASFSRGRWWNYALYFLMDLLNWLALGSSLNRVRVREYVMRPIRMLATNDFPKAKIPFICLWSSHILPKPLEWDREVIIGGYTYSDHGTHYNPPDSLKAFLDTQQSVLAIGFGSMTIPDPAKLISTLSSAVGRIQARAVVCRSWSAKLEMGINIPPYLYLVDTIPHSWLLPQVDGFVHHGGAGHTAAGLRAGVPMLLIPFLLDQFLWAAKICELQLGPQPLERHTLTTHNLAASLRRLLTDGYRDRCTEVAKQIQAEGDGADVAADVVLRELALPEMKLSCSLIPALRAEWQHKESGIPLSGAAATYLASCEILSWEDLNLQPRINWTKRFRTVNTSLGWTYMLCNVTSLVNFVLAIFDAITLWIVGTKAGTQSADKKHNTVKIQDPVRLARIRQGEFDLEFIKQNADEKQGAAIDDQIVKHWQALAAAKFHEQCLNGKPDDVKSS